MKTGVGLGCPVYGPCEHADLVGLDLAKGVRDYVLPDLTTTKRAGELHQEKVATGELGAEVGKGVLEWPAEEGDQVRGAM